ncbi:fructosamine kinase family protein [Paraferrimonas sedimenticola]|uniref:Fructosamine-3-kinase n=1 Tax=Paraferrimonas sedimenticola TaxID=375674 RepID=A0AA37W1M8_9GAMM|nr:fructosamine kinase family protein [Paraferrimonas sedimenticola]GLP96462.1 hypothetical protein GCM10007895_17680 [Paraferrimonas sedimenticola]
MTQQLAAHIQTKISETLGVAIESANPVSGGDIAESYRVTAGKQAFFVKIRPQNAPPELLPCEAVGLNAIAATGSIDTPEVIASDKDFLVLPALTPKRADEEHWRTLGRGLAKLHSAPQTEFGFVHDNFCGLTLQPNPRTANGFDFFAEHRLLHQTQLAFDKGLLTAKDCQELELLAGRLSRWIPAQAPSLVHGDLWSGNQMCTEQGSVVIDPAAHWGWREVDIGMSLMFGGFERAFYDSYQEHFPMENRWQERMPLYNLYHWLNHLNLFGGQYLPEVRSTLQRFC